jgi:ribonuclease HI
VRHVQSSWDFTAQVGGRTVHENSGAFRHTTSSKTMEVMAVTKALYWLDTQAFTNASVLNDPMSMIRNVEAGCRRREWLTLLRRSNLVSTSFIFVQGHAGVRGNERADRLAGTAAISDGREMVHALRETGRVEDLEIMSRALLKD